MKKHWKKILLSILGFFIVCIVIVLRPSYMENTEWEKKREQIAIGSKNITNDFNSSKKRNKVFNELYSKVKDIAYKHDFYISTDDPEDVCFLSSINDDDYRFGLDYYVNNSDFLVLSLDIESENIEEEFNSKDYEVLQDIIDILDISDFSIYIRGASAPSWQSSTINFDNDWFLYYRYTASSSDTNNSVTKNMRLEFRKNIFKKGNELCKELYSKIKDIGDKYNFNINKDTYEEAEKFYLVLDKSGDDYESITGKYLPEDYLTKNDLVLEYYIESESIEEEFNSKDYEVLQDIIDILDISDFSISNTESSATPITEKSINFNNGWGLNYSSYKTSRKDEWFPDPDTYFRKVRLEFKKKI